MSHEKLPDAEPTMLRMNYYLLNPAHGAIRVERETIPSEKIGDDASGGLSNVKIDIFRFYELRESHGECGALDYELR